MNARLATIENALFAVTRNTIFGGDLTVSSGASMDAFDHIEVITGSLYVRDNPTLQSTTGFTNLLSVGGDLIMRKNNALRDIEFPNLRSIGGFLSIVDHNALETITGFGNLSSVGGSISIYVNRALESIAGFNSLSSVGGYFVIAGNDRFTTITGFNHLSSVGGEFSIRHVRRGTVFSGLSNLTCHGGFNGADPYYCQNCPARLLNLPRC